MQESLIRGVRLKVVDGDPVVHVQVEAFHAVVYYHDICEAAVRLEDLQVLQVHLVVTGIQALLESEDVREEALPGHDRVHGSDHHAGRRFAPEGLRKILRGHRLGISPKEVFPRKLALPVVLVQSSRKCLGIIKGANSEEDKLKIWVELNKHLKNVGSKAEIHWHGLFLAVCQCFGQPNRSCLQIWMLRERVSLGKDEGLIDIENYGFSFYINLKPFISLLLVLFAYYYCSL